MNHVALIKDYQVRLFAEYLITHRPTITLRADLQYTPDRIDLKVWHLECDQWTEAVVAVIRTREE